MLILSLDFVGRTVEHGTVLNCSVAEIKYVSAQDSSCGAPSETASAAKGCMTQDAFSRAGLHCLSSERAERPGRLSPTLGGSGGPF